MTAKKGKFLRITLVELHQLERLKKMEIRQIAGGGGIIGGFCPRNCDCSGGYRDTSAAVFVMAPNITEWSSMV